MKKRRWILISTVFVLIVAVLIILNLNKETVKSDGGNHSNEAIELDFSQINTVVREGLIDEPKVEKEINAIKTEKSPIQPRHSTSVRDLFSIEKTKFRINAENKLMGKQLSEQQLNEYAKKQNDGYLNALYIAEKHYDIKVSEDEVTNYIKKNIIGVKAENSQKYADALGLTTEQVDLEFDRDIYLMDTLWTKLTPVLMERYPQIKGEDQNAYSDRIKKTFYNND